MRTGDFFDRVDLAVSVGKGVINIEFIPDFLSGNDLVRIADIDKLSAGDQARINAELLVRADLSWDLEDNAGVAIPVNAESLMAVDLKFLRPVLTAMMEYSAPKAEN